MQQIIRHLFKTESLEDVPRARLEELVEAHPSFGIAHYLLSRKLKSENDDRFTEETQRTNLYFPNPFWLHWLLEDHGEEKEWTLRPIPHETQEGDEPKVDTQEMQGTTQEMQETTQEMPGDIPAGGDGALVAMGEVTDFIGSPVEALAGSTDVTAYPAEEGSSEEVITHAPLEEQHFLEALTPAGMEPEAGLQPEELQTNETDPVQQTPAPAQQASASAEHVSASTEHVSAPTEEPKTESVQVGDAPVQQPAQQEEPLVFQSYHTIDYFASQGIKLSVEESQNPSDKLGRQLKSFTEWLKVMKKLPQKDAGSVGVSDFAAEQKIQAFAAHSIEGREVVTETMAEVLAKQGMWDKAAEVYRKLSLLDPAKSAYFASLVGQMQARANEQLNTN